MYQCIYLCELLRVWMEEENQNDNTFTIEYIFVLKCVNFEIKREWEGEREKERESIFGLLTDVFNI